MKKTFKKIRKTKKYIYGFLYEIACQIVETCKEIKSLDEELEIEDSTKKDEIRWSLQYAEFLKSQKNCPLKKADLVRTLISYGKKNIELAKLRDAKLDKLLED